MNGNTTITRTDTERRAALETTAKADAHAAAARRMRRGKRLVVSGFLVAVAGIIGYSAACFGASADPEIGSTLLENPARLVGPALAVIGLGTLLWLIGSLLYLGGAMESDPEGPDISF